MLYLSQILGRPIFDAEGEKIAAIKDVIVRYGEEDYPPVLGLVARYRRRNFFMPRTQFSTFSEHGAKMTSEVLDLRPFTRRTGEVLLAKDPHYQHCSLLHDTGQKQGLDLLRMQTVWK